ncbi:BREX-1 system adenine-specific DNA-methyltransferase PglX [Photobacterium carnosum]|uniref:site-specific DNA-methyltransferase (adenine-specific) n=1 Tax=Photobacterium carnosum TaxID=2023717 RepID=A0A2N4UM52_9GAMM|nr:BREX-1 system adenine-specific DNA-methyltransferase PglX [Photobacterium carnosum]PLC56099.1 SAM-dependent methyltransferase [Photobacterium carnosum]
MNTNNIKKYASKARIAFFEAVVSRANNLGIYADRIDEAMITGDVMQVGDKTFPVSQKSQRDALVKLIEQQGFHVVAAHTASTWFNRLCALRFMELKEYLDHGYRVLSHPSQMNGFEILGHATDVAEELGLNRSEVLEMSLAGDKEEELYRQLLLGQCHVLHDAMDFLFDKVDSVSELLLPDGLTRTDSILRSLVDDVPEEDWDQVEIIGWLYQFYISEKKDEVMGKVVKSEDIPAATQLFTPNWIVQYLVQNSVGRQWLQTYPESSIKADMPYYIEPAEQTDEVNAQLAEITPDSLEPEAIKVLDPACGSGHILVEAYNTLKAIYDERGYRSREIPQLILENNLFGLDIDDRAAQLAGFALMMMAREDDRRIFTRGIKLNVLSLQESAHLDIPQLWRDLDLNDDQQVGQSQNLFVEQEYELDIEDENFKLIQLIKQWFLQAKTLGALIDVPVEYQQQLKALKDKLLELQESGNTAQKLAAELLLPFIQQALLLSLRYDSVIANPPYMGNKGMNAELKDRVLKSFPRSKHDLFAMFIERCLQLNKVNGYSALITMQSWMFLSSYEQLRRYLLKNHTLCSLVQIGYNSFPSLNSKVAQAAMFVFNKQAIDNGLSQFIDLNSAPAAADKEQVFLNRTHDMLFELDTGVLDALPGSSLAYWLTEKERSCFDLSELSEHGAVRQGLATGDDEQFIRYWYEISQNSMCTGSDSLEAAETSKAKWFPLNKGGQMRRWYGNQELVINWENDGESLKDFVSARYGNYTKRLASIDYYFKPGITWSLIGSAQPSFRFFEKGAIISHKGPGIFSNKIDPLILLAYLNSNVAAKLLNTMTTGTSFEVGHLKQLPIVVPDEYENIPRKLLTIYQDDWNQSELSWAFSSDVLMSFSTDCMSVKKAFEQYRIAQQNKIDTANDLYSQNDLFFTELFGLKNLEASENASVDLKLAEESTDIANFISYFVGCAIGRYSLDREGLVYAHAGNEGFADLVNQGAYKTFAADDDGIIPLTDMEWFPDDATYRFRDFVRIVWGEEHLQQNLDFVAESLCQHAIKPKRGESSLDSIRRYMSAQFYNDHLKTYKKRPIYWLFSSGKQKAFECLVYLHRYNESTLSRMRTEYVTPLLGKYGARLGQLEQQLDSASTSERTKLKKEMTALEKKQAELRTFDDNLKHYADMRISLDLDDGVKENYGKFGDLLADVKVIHGKIVK